MNGVVLADGCFDPMHPGHLEYLRAAAVFGRLCVNVAPDSIIRAKGREPLQSATDRALIVCALRYVDVVHVMPTLEALRLIRPSVYVKGADWRGRLPEDHIALCAELGIDVVYVDTRTRHSSADLLRRWLVKMQESWSRG